LKGDCRISLAQRFLRVRRAVRPRGRIRYCECRHREPTGCIRRPRWLAMTGYARRLQLRQLRDGYLSALRLRARLAMQMRGYAVQKWPHFFVQNIVAHCELFSEN